MNFNPRSIQPRRSQNLLQLARPNHGVDFRNVLPNLVPIALHQAPGDNQPSRFAGHFVLRHFQNRVHRFLLGRVDKRAGVHNEDFSRLDIRGHLGARAIEQSHHHLAVNEIFRTAQADEPDLRTYREARKGISGFRRVDDGRNRFVEKR